MRKPIVLAMLLATAACFPAAAQSPAAQARRPGVEPDRAAMMKARADDIALLIGLRADQRAGLDAVLEHRMMPPPGGPERGPMGRAAEGPPPNFEARIAELEKHENAGRQRLAAVKAFYQGLDAQQKARFEAVMRLRGGPGHGFGPAFGPGRFGGAPLMGGMPMHGMPGGPEGHGPPL